ncbi:hypothetical protein [Helicobacter sp. T3_23-1056]
MAFYSDRLPRATSCARNDGNANSFNDGNVTFNDKVANSRNDDNHSVIASKSQDLRGNPQCNTESIDCHADFIKSARNDCNAKSHRYKKTHPHPTGCEALAEAKTPSAREGGQEVCESVMGWKILPLLKIALLSLRAWLRHAWQSKKAPPLRRWLGGG